MAREPRLIDLFGKPKSKRRPFITQDGTAIARPVIVRGESYPIAGEPVAMDARPRADLREVTFDGAMPPQEDF